MSDKLPGTKRSRVLVADGTASLVSAIAQTPDLILTGVILPRFDGVRLVTALRADPRTRDVPVIMLTGDAGADTSLESMLKGADDFLVQPFSADELLARVSMQLTMARRHRESSAAIQASAARFQALVGASSDVAYRMNADWSETRDKNGAVVEWLGMASDVTARKQAENVLRDNAHEYRALFKSMDHEVCMTEMIFDADSRPIDSGFLQSSPTFERQSGIRDAHGKRMREIEPDHDLYAGSAP